MRAHEPPNNRMKLTKRPRGATVSQTGGAACAFAHRAFRSLSGCYADNEGSERGHNARLNTDTT